MKPGTVQSECRSLQSIRQAWQAPGWPLDRINGENGILDLLYSLHNFTLYDALSTESENVQTIEQLLDDLVDFYQTALQAWDEFRTVFDHPQRQHFLRWPEGTYPTEIRQLARWRFWELVTTTRFEVRDIRTAGDLIRIQFDATPPLERRHIVSLAIMVCIKDAIEALEVTDLQEALHARDDAAFWLTHFETLTVASGDLRRAAKKASDEATHKFKAERSRQATHAAKKLRSPLTPELVAKHFKANPGKLQKALVLELMECFDVSARTVATRLQDAKKMHLMQ